MKNSYKESIDRVRAELLNATGIDFGRYQKPELVTKVSSILMFPMYALPTLLWPIVLSACFFVAAHISYLTRNPSIVGELFFLIIGIPIFISLGISAGLFLLVRRIKADLKAITEASLELARSAISDVESAIGNLTAKGATVVQSLPSPSQIVRGMLVVSILPTVEQIISRKVKLVGPAVSKIVLPMLLTVAETLCSSAENVIANTKVVKKADDKLGSVQDGISSRLESVSDNAAIIKWRETVKSGIDRVGSTSGAVIDSVCGKVIRRFRVGFALSFVAVLIFLGIFV